MSNNEQKQLILQAAQVHHDNQTADMIYLNLWAIDNHISLGTVYRNLERLCEIDNLLRIKVPVADRYDSRLDYHYHMICTSCGNVFDASVAYQGDLDRILVEKSGFKVVRHITVFEGQRSACAESLRELE